MAAPFDLTRLKKDHNKKRTAKDGFYDPHTWIDTGNYALNKMISGEFKRGIPLSGVTVFAGESGCLPENAKVTTRHVSPDGKTLVTNNVSINSLKNFIDRKKNNKIEINTPDGFQEITEWFDKGLMNLIKIKTSNFETTCAVNHLIETPSGFFQAQEMFVGDSILTEKGYEKITDIEPAGQANCYDFTIDHPNHRYYGDGISSHNSSKSYIVSGNIVRDALAQGCYVVLMDTEDALKAAWMRKLGVDPDHPRLVKYVKSTVDEIVEVINDFTTEYRKDYYNTPIDEQPKILFVIDSLGFLGTTTSVEQFEKNDLKGDKGIKAKALKALVGNCIRLFAGYQLGVVATNHTYKSQDMYHPDDIISGGDGVTFASSIIVSMNKKKLKEDEDGNKTKEVSGIIAKIKCVKTRFSKPFEEVEISIPWSQGMNPYSGMFDMCVSKGILKKVGNRYLYTDKAGNEYIQFKKNIPDSLYQLIMDEWEDKILLIDNNDNIENEENIEE